MRDFEKNRKLSKHSVSKFGNYFGMTYLEINTYVFETSQPKSYFHIPEQAILGVF